MGSGKNFGDKKTGFANMPTEVHQEEYPKRESLGYEIDDTITGIDQVCDHAKGKVKKHVSNQK